MLSVSAGGSPHPDDWRVVRRASAHVDLRDLPRITAIAATPSWGATEWMRQCSDHLTSASSARVRWVTNRRALAHALTTAGDDFDVLVIDDLIVTAGDPLWADIASLVRARDHVSVIIHCLDSPPATGIEDVRVITERHLALSREEVEQLVSLNGVDCPPGLYATLATRYAGNPALVRQRLERLRSTATTWSNPDTRIEVALATALTSRLQRAPAQARETSLMLRVVVSAAMFRRVTVDVLWEVLGRGPEVDDHFARLTVLPFGRTSIDDESGRTVFEWLPAVWDLIERERGPEQRRLDARRAHDAAARAGHLSLQLHCLVALDDIAAAERLAHDEFRYFLLALPEITARTLAGVAWHAMADAPSLLLLAGEHRMRLSGGGERSPEFARAALRALERRSPSTAWEQLRHTTRTLFAHVSLGHRAETIRSLDAVHDLLDADSHRSLLATAATDSDVAARLAAEMYVSFWAATQVDDHAAGLRFVQVMHAHANVTSRTAVADHYIVMTQEIFMGLREEDRDDLGLAHTDPMIMVEHGEDQRALDQIRLLGERIASSPSRSGAEGFMLTLLAAVSPESLDPARLHEPLQRSAAFWTDGKPSTVVHGATTVALLATGDLAAATRLLRSQPGEDWFTLAACAMVMLANDRAEDAMAALRRAAGACDVPRANAVTGTLAAVAHLRLGRRDAARRRFENTVRTTSPRLTRMALRFVPDEDFAVLSEDVERYSDDARATLTAAAADARHFRRSQAVRLTRVERELLHLVREGATNPQIAQRRFVSVNTVRTQMRQLLRKLGAKDRDEAVTVAERLSMFDQS